MKNSIFLAIILFIGFISCRNTEEGVQVIDQKIHLYIDSAGIDMLNSSDTLAYSQLTFNDVYGLTESSPVSLTSQMGEDSIYFRAYTAGATRKLVDSSMSDFLIYESKIALKLTTRVNNSVSYASYDTLTVKYKNSSEVFQVNEVLYNNQLSNIEKVDGVYQVKIQKNP